MTTRHFDLIFTSFSLRFSIKMIVVFKKFREIRLTLAQTLFDDTEACEHKLKRALFCKL